MDELLVARAVRVLDGLHGLEESPEVHPVLVKRDEHLPGYRVQLRPANPAGVFQRPRDLRGQPFAGGPRQAPDLDVAAAVARPRAPARRSCPVWSGKHRSAPPLLHLTVSFAIHGTPGMAPDTRGRRFYSCP